jgi:GNAT superfamily N-acetyltransferase
VAGGAGDMTASFTMRVPRRADLAGVVALLRACDEAEFGHPDTDDADVLADWDGTGFALENDARVALSRETPSTGGSAGETIVGYAHTFEKLIDVEVHPGQNGLGIGTALREFAERRALAQAVTATGTADTPTGMPDADESHAVGVKVWQAPRRSNRTAHRLLEAAGYTRGHHYAEMEIELGGDLPEPRWPAGIAVRTFEIGRDAPACHALQNLAWGQYKTYEPVSFERWADLIREPGFDPSLWFLAEEDGALAGLCLCREYEDQAWVTSLAVDPRYRGRGLGEALLRHVFARLCARGIVRVGLSVSSRTTQSAWRIYERVGMHDSGGWVAFEKALRAARPA